MYIDGLNALGILHQPTYGGCRCVMYGGYNYPERDTIEIFLSLDLLLEVWDWLNHLV